MSDSSNSEDQPEVEFIYKVQEELSSGEEQPMSEWSSVIIESPQRNMKRHLHSQGLYDTGSGNICTKTIAMSDSDIFRHLYYNYPAVLDPGIKQAILSPEKPIIYPDDGRDLYLALCKEMNECVVRMFHRNLLSDEINLGYYGISPAGVRPMAMALEFNKSVRRFNLTDNFLNDDACYHLAQMLASNVTLTELNLTGCRIGASGILRLIDTLSINRSLQILNLARNEIGEIGGVHFAEQLARGIVVPRVSLSCNQLGKQTALALASALEFTNKLTHLDLSRNNFFFAPTTIKLIEQLANSKVLQELNLAFNALEGERVAGAIKCIMKVPTLTVLDLSYNRFQLEAIPIIIADLFKAKKLTTLDLSFNPLTPADAYLVLEKMLKPRVKLQTLLLENIWVTKNFITCLEKVKKMKSRQNFVVKYDGVLANWKIEAPDARTLILRRADYLCTKDKKHRVDLALFFLQLYKDYQKPIPVKDLMDKVADEAVPLDENLISELSYIFPGPKSKKTRYVNLETLCEFIQRLWPEKKLPPTPPPEPEPEPEPIPEPPKKGKGKGKGKK